ncbi:MAG: hypothetical protein ACREUW_11245, partial [Burkholderiales bacterium]
PLGRPREKCRNAMKLMIKTCSSKSNQASKKPVIVTTYERSSETIHTLIHSNCGQPQKALTGKAVGFFS